MSQIQETKHFSSAEAEQGQKESGIHWADGYNHKQGNEAGDPQDWSTIILYLLGGNGANGGNGEGASAIANRMIQASKVFVQLNEFWSDAIKDLPELYQVGADSEKKQEIFESWIDRYKDVLKNRPDLLPLAGQTGEIFTAWAHILQLNHKTNEPVWNAWMEAMPQWQDQSAKLAKGDLKAIEEGFRLWQEVYDETLGRVFEMPGLGLPKQHTEKMARTYAEFTQFAAALPYFYQYLISTEIAALQEVFDEIQEQEINEATPESLKKVYNIWLTTSEKAFHTLFKRPDFCHTVGEVLNCMFRLKKQLNELTACWCEAMSIPSNRDHDNMAMAIQDLRRKVHAQQKTISALEKHINTIKTGRDEDAAAV